MRMVTFDQLPDDHPPGEAVCDRHKWRVGGTRRNESEGGWLGRSPLTEFSPRRGGVYQNGGSATAIRDESVEETRFGRVGSMAPQARTILAAKIAAEGSAST
jgi:hypothetical protein